jgi:hypothetical protein
MKTFDPRKFIDREFEQEIFEELLEFRSYARILAIRAQSGMGKSNLLAKFHYRCRTVRPRTPICLIDLKQLPDHSSLILLKQIVKDLENSFEIPFPAFQRAEGARVSADFLSIRSLSTLPPPELPHLCQTRPRDTYSCFEDGVKILLRRTGSTHKNYHQLLALEYRLKENIETARTYGNSETHKTERSQIIAQLNAFALSQLNISFNDLCESPDPPMPDFPDDFFPAPRAPGLPDSPSLTAEQEEVARNVCERAFFDDLRDYPHPLVLMIDSYERCEETLRRWLNEYLLERAFFDLEKRPQRLLLVIAGQEIPPFESHWSLEECETVVRSVAELRRWTRDHVEQCLRVHGFPYETKDIDTFYRLVELGIPPSQVVQTIEAALAVKRGEAA